jgi:hypothetical protein
LARHLLPLKPYQEAIAGHVRAARPAAGLGFAIPWGLLILVSGESFTAALVTASIAGLFFGFVFPAALKPMMVRLTLALYADAAREDLAAGTGAGEYQLLCSTWQGRRRVHGVIRFGRDDTTFNPAVRMSIGRPAVSLGPPGGVTATAVPAPTGFARWLPWKLGGIRLRSSVGTGFYQVPEPEFTANAVAQVLERLAASSERQPR